MEKPRFETVGKGPYARMERIKDNTSVSEKKVQKLKSTKKAQKTEESYRQPDTNRRAFLKGIASGVALVAGAGTLRDFDSGESESKSFAADNAKERMPHDESYEKESHSHYFESEIEGYKAMALLEKDEILFVDESNMPVGNPVKFQEYIDEKYDDEGKLVMEQYRYSPWKTKNEIGIPKEGLVTEWIEYVKNKVQSEYPDRSIAGKLHAYQDIQNAYDQPDEPELKAYIKEGKITRYIDVVNYFAQKPVIGASHMNRLEYVQEKISFKPFVPEVVQEECRRLLPGLCAEESRFNADLISSSGAKSIFQIKPDTWSDYNTQISEMNLLVSQTEVAGQLLSDIFKWLMGGNLISHENMNILLNKFDSEEAFYRDFLVPVIINTYNTGIGTATKWINSYVESVPESQMKSGKDLFLGMANFGIKNPRDNYGEEARKYVTKIYAQAEVLAEQERYS